MFTRSKKFILIPYFLTIIIFLFGFKVKAVSFALPLEKHLYNSPYAFQENKLGLGIELEGKEMTLFDIRQTHRDEDLLKGRITQAEYLEGMQAESMGALLGLGLLADIYTGGLLSEGLMFTGLVRSSDLTEQAHDLKKLGDKKGAEAKLNAAGEASKIAIYGFASELAGAGISKAVRSVGRGAEESKTIIGETMNRVEVVSAKNPGSTILNKMPTFSGSPHQVTSQMMQYNRQWLLQQMRSGRPILDIGLDPTRKMPSIFYKMEQDMIKNYQKLYPGSLKVIK